MHTEAYVGAKNNACASLSMPLATVKVLESDKNIRIDRWFKRHLSHVTFTQVAKLVRQGRIRVNGFKVNVSTRVQAEQDISFPGELTVVPSTPHIKVISNKHKTELVKKLKEAILYKDSDIIAFNKAEGMSVQGGTNVHIAIDDVLDEFRFEAAERPRLVHRLDRNTTGVLIIARTREAASLVSESIRNHMMSKEYIAILHGVPQPMTGQITAPILLRSEHVEQPKLLESLSLYEVLAYLKDKVSLVKFQPQTGRKHQLRLHALHIGHPVLGDERYGSQPLQQGIKERLYLHSYVTKINYREKAITVKAPLPAYFSEALSVLGLDISRLSYITKKDL
ncbi:RluA family pseudouridine synthase [Rickettsiales endosymbiont of Peranema trichophorum]|uniref:RluA family pseudouridine synthase n=1 Tax=Rickettsiales endosymbiont of Peranema trichophorum TaxID=2486577 RepID=UPI001023CD0C|nr:RluA family pseudouridine synthase [Rickettsiales endosymbiont of Peranema trichophorum]RZI45626.1 RluA family pseudouridine synthase [Rickettsiales endosymbiont of Peranema trichophorum]